MIKLSEINETSWGGMVRRSSSEVVRKQDEPDWINLGPEFDCLWLNGVYEKDEKNEFTYDEVKDIVSSIPGAELPSFEDLKKLKCTFIENEKHLYIEGSENHMDPIYGLWRVWNNKGGVCLLGLGAPKIRLAMNGDKYPFLLVKRKLNETSWGGMVRRSSSEVVRKEDELDGLSFKEFFDVIKEKYRVVDDSYEPMFRMWGMSSFSIPFCNIGRGRRMCMTIDLGNGDEGTVSSIMMDADIFNRFHIGDILFHEDVNTREQSGLKYISSEKMGFGKCSRLIDLIIKQIPEPLVKMNVNETSWGGMVRRSNSEKQVRKEDEVKMEYFPYTRLELATILMNMRKNLTDSVLDARSIDVSRVEDFSNIFEDFDVKYIDVRGWNTSRCIDMDSVFSGCDKLEEIIGIEKWDVSNVKRMEDMFYDCEKLKTLSISNWNVGNVKRTSYMFGNCFELESLNLGNWKTSNLQNTYGMFSGCKKLETIDVSGWNVRNLENTENMFAGCEALKVLDVKNWRPVELIDMDNMFAWCGSLEELDLSGWKLKYRIPVSGMFKGCPEKVKWVFDKDHFYKAIEETSWGGMVRRSSSDVVRKENWLNGLGRREFYDHLEKTYDTRYGRNIIFAKDREMILVPITGLRSPMYLHLIYDHDKLMEIYYCTPNKSLGVTLSDTFNVDFDGVGITHISSKNGEVNNETAIDAIEAIMDIVTSPAIVRKGVE